MKILANLKILITVFCIFTSSLCLAQVGGNPFFSFPGSSSGLYWPVGLNILKTLQAQTGVTGGYNPGNYAANPSNIYTDASIMQMGIRSLR